MSVFFLQGLKNIEKRLIKPVITIGNFDGVHLGHQALFAKVVERAQAIGGTSVVLTFIPHPINVLYPKTNLPLITPIKRKIELIQSFNIEVILCMRFNKKIAVISASDFIDIFLIKYLGIVELVVGYDFIFGYKGLGNLNFLRKKAQKMGFFLHLLKPVIIDNQPVSSTRIRQSLLDSNISNARRFMGVPYRISGRVVSGYGIGSRILGYPTINLRIKKNFLLGNGVYAVLVYLNSQSKLGVTNIGLNYTFDTKELSIETFLIDYNGYLYGHNIMLDFIEYLRKGKRFNSSKELAIQISYDVENARKILINWLNS